MESFTTNLTQNYVQQLYQKNQNAVRDSKTEKTGNRNKNTQRASQELREKEEAAVYEKGTTEKKATYEKPVLSSHQKDLQTKLSETYEKLSETAKSYLEELKARYGDIEFFVADVSSDEEMNRYFAMGTKKYSCVISSATLEQMASDEEIRAKYEAMIDGADEKLEEVKSQVKEELGEEAADQIETIGFSIGENGVVDYFVKLKESNTAYYEKQKEKRAEERKEERAEERKWERKEERVGEKVPGKWLHADSAEELLQAIREALGIEKEKELHVGKTQEQED